MAISLGEYQDVFLDEADELLQELNQDLLKLEKDPNDVEMINNIFRAAHTLKSSAAFVGLTDLSELAHQMEDLLQGVRDGTMKITQEMLNLIFKCFDAINAVVESISAGEEPDQDLLSLIDQIHKIAKTNKEEPAPEPEAAEPAQAEPAQAAQSEESAFVVPQIKLGVDDIKTIRDALENGLSCREFTVYVDPAAQMKSLKQELVVAGFEKNSTIIRQPDEENNLAKGNVFRIIVASSGTVDDLLHCCNIDQIIKAVVRNVTIDKQDGRTAVRFDSAGEFTMGTVETEKIETPAARGASAPSSAATVAAASKTPPKTDDDARRKITPASKNVKVAIEKLDQLMNNVGELVIVNSGFYRLYNDIMNIVQDKSITTEFKNRMDEMARISKDLQSGIMKTRMFPVGQVFNRFERLVRDLAHESKKNVELVINGEDTELDKKVIDSIGDPLLHLIRNAVDHGVEPPEMRTELGKPAVAAVTLNAYQSGSQIVIEVSDDGSGLDTAKIKKKAVEKGLIDSEAAENLSENDIFSFIFMPGFSTADKITDISGRGVGMNVVKETVTELNGNVSIRTEKGVGTTFQLEFPLTLAIISAVLARVGDEIYAIPLSDIDETINVSYPDITTIEGHEVINLRGDVLSLLRLSRFVGKRSTLKKEDKIPIVVAGFAKKKVGLMVDALEGKMEIVIKSLEQNYRTVNGLAGASILGDGSICLILDVASMVNMAITDQNGYYSSKTMFDGDIGMAEEKRADAVAEDEETASEQAEAAAAATSEEESEAALAAEEEEEAAKKREAEEKIKAEKRAAKLEGLDEIDRIFADIDTIDTEEKSEAEETETTEQNAQKEDSKESAEKAPDVPADGGAPKEASVQPSGGEPAAGMPQAADTPQAAGKPQAADASPAAGTPQVADAPQVTGTPQAADTPQAEEHEDDHSAQGSPPIEQRVQDALSEFKRELKQNINDTLHDELGAGTESFPVEALKQLQLIANVGASHAAESMSKILSKQIGLSIPDVSVTVVENVPKRIGCLENQVYVGGVMNVDEMFGSVLLLFDEQMAFSFLDGLYGSSVRKTGVLDEYSESILKEITNIVGSSLMNIVAEKLKIVIQPDVPVFFRNNVNAILEMAATLESTEGNVIIMDTAFFFEDDKLLAHLVLMPRNDSAESFLRLEKLSN